MLVHLLDRFGSERGSFPLTDEIVFECPEWWGGGVTVAQILVSGGRKAGELFHPMLPFHLDPGDTFTIQSLKTKVQAAPFPLPVIYRGTRAAWHR